MLINFRTVMKPSHHGQSFHLSSNLPDACGLRETGGDVWGLLSIKGQQKSHSLAQDMLHIQEYAHNQYARQAKGNILDQDVVLFLAVTH